MPSSDVTGSVSNGGRGQRVMKILGLDGSNQQAPAIFKDDQDSLPTGNRTRLALLHLSYASPSYIPQRSIGDHIGGDDIRQGIYVGNKRMKVDG